VFQVSGKALAAGFSADPEPVASAIPLSYFFADPWNRHFSNCFRFCQRGVTMSRHCRPTMGNSQNDPLPLEFCDVG
jgi:hypothetical protein